MIKEGVTTREWRAVQLKKVKKCLTAADVSAAEKTMHLDRRWIAGSGRSAAQNVAVTVAPSSE